MQKIEKLEWDSGFFEKDIFRITLENEDFDPEMLEFPDSFYYLFSSRKQDFLKSKLKDQKLVYSKELSSKKDDNMSIVEYDGAINDQLLKLAFESGAFSRFKLDDQLNHKFEELYSKWLENSLNKKFADLVLVYAEEEKILGFITVKLNVDHGLIGLIAVDEDARGKGIGKSLIQKVENFCIDHGLKILKVPTQMANKVACSFYERNEFEIESLTYIYHLQS